MKSIVTSGKIVQVGNSSALILPMVIFDNYPFKKGDSVKIRLTDQGLVILTKEIKHGKRK